MTQAVDAVTIAPTTAAPISDAPTATDYNALLSDLSALVDSVIAIKAAASG